MEYVARIGRRAEHAENKFEIVKGNICIYEKIILKGLFKNG
jgi:hypothetical protein